MSGRLEGEKYILLLMGFGPQTISAKLLFMEVWKITVDTTKMMDLYAKQLSMTLLAL
jgi:hypothetical protein